MTIMWNAPLTLRSPGLFITSTDTGVGKTVVTCAIAAALRRVKADLRVGVSKPISCGCRHDREGLVHEDAEALAHFADCRLPLSAINPIRFAAPLAPAVAAQQSNEPMDWNELRRQLLQMDQASDVMLVEGAGGLLVPIDPDDAQRTILDLALTIGYPTIVVARSVLGTLNHTAMTVRLLRDAGLHVAGVVMNGYNAEDRDPSVATNRLWIEKQCKCPVLTIVPQCAEVNVRPHKAVIDAAVLDAVAQVDWHRLAARPAKVK